MLKKKLNNNIDYHAIISWKKSTVIIIDIGTYVPTL